MSATPATVRELLQQLIRIPSVNPDGDPGTPHTGEKACAEFVGEFLRRCGAQVTCDEVLPGRPNVIGRFPSSRGEGRPRILLAPHLDTVGVGGMTIAPFDGGERGGKIFGRGASDTKGSMAAMLWALWELRDRIGGLGAAVSFAGFMGEESGQPGSRHFAEHYRGQFDFAIAGEPTGLDIVHACKSVIWAELTATGSPAHASTPERGDNAITRLTPVLAAIDTELRAEIAAFTNPVLGAPTVNIGMIRGGDRANIVPGRCWAAVDLRETPELVAAGGAKGKLGELLRRHGWAGDIAVRFAVDSTPLYTDPEHPVIRKMRDLGARPVGAPWFCDAGWLAETGGIPAVACGPGSIAQAHTADEWIAVEDLEAGVRFFRRFLESL